MDEFYIQLCNKSQIWHEKLEGIDEDCKEIVNNTEFRGEAADAIKTYFKEVYGVIIPALTIAISRLQTGFLQYKMKYYSIESSENARLPQENIEEVASLLKKEIGIYDEIQSEIKHRLNSVADIFSEPLPSGKKLEEELNDVYNGVSRLNNTIKKCEVSV